VNTGAVIAAATIHGRRRNRRRNRARIRSHIFVRLDLLNQVFSDGHY
jgi:hypothetical protein